MSDYIEVMAIVEGKTEELFIKRILRKYLADENIYIRATQIKKGGQKGGGVRFNRIRNDLEKHLKQRSDTYVTTMVDYYGVKEWPGLNKVPPQTSPREVARIVNDATKNEVIKLFADQQAARRFIPYMAIHEFEALLFSRSSVIAEKLEVTEDEVNAVLDECGEPEAINNNRNTAPSKRFGSIYHPAQKICQDDGWNRHSRSYRNRNYARAVSTF